MFIAASASLVLLAESLWRSLRIDIDGQAGTDGGLFIAAVISATLFVTVIIVNRLARRLTDQERLASSRGEDLRNQVAINELVIAELDRGVVVFDRKGGIRGMNPKARMILGLRGGASVQAADQGALATLRALTASEQLVADVAVGTEGERKTRIRARVLNGGGGAASLADRVVLLEDLENLEERAQQLKLAAMGRLSASIAHEIRNPLGAIRHAGNLLAEQMPEGPQRRMTTIIEENSLRIDRIVEDVLSISRRSASREAVLLPQFFSAFLPEFVAQADTSWERIVVEFRCAESIQFDPNHLRQVLVNLLGNALRYASDTPGAILVRWEDSGNRHCELRVLDDGPGIGSADRHHLFEPFFTTESRGTGLGLHMAQELCAANGAQLRYESRSGDRFGGGFVIEPELAPRRRPVSGRRADAAVRPTAPPPQALAPGAAGAGGPGQGGRQAEGQAEGQAGRHAGAQAGGGRWQQKQTV
jgi:two-component system sensor histidine kinase PilS (NtrC family)